MQIFEISRSFSKEETYSLTGQIRKSSRSVCICLIEAYRKKRYPAHFVSTHHCLLPIEKMPTDFLYIIDSYRWWNTSRRVDRKPTRRMAKKRNCYHRHFCVGNRSHVFQSLSKTIYNDTFPVWRDGSWIIYDHRTRTRNVKKFQSRYLHCTWNYYSVLWRRNKGCVPE